VAVGLAVASALALSLLFGGEGHLSVDSVQHAFEAVGAHSVSTQPPVMAAWLALWGAAIDLPRAVMAAVLAQATIGALALALPAWSARAPRSWPWLVVAVVAPLSPLLMLYAGIVWKDVLFASLLLVSTALLCAANALERPAVVRLLALASAVAAAGLVLLRPQGWVLLLLALVVIWRLPVFRAAPRWRWPLVAVVALAVLGLGEAVDRMIPGHEGRASRAAVANLVRFDLAGIDAHRPGAVDFSEALSPTDIEALRAAYAPSRGDGLAVAEAYAQWIRQQSMKQLSQRWWEAVVAAPSAYGEHRAQAAAWLWGLRDPRACLPIHLGVEGLPDQVAALGLSTAPRPSDVALYARVSPWFGSPWFRPATYGALLVLAAVWALAFRRGLERRLVLTVVVGAAAYAATTTPIAFACDLRYLYPLVGLASLAWMLLAFRFPAGDMPGARTR
jgi:hypothetical protein